MRILYDGAAFQNAHQRGIQRCFTELIARLPAEARATLALSSGARAELPAGAKVVRADLRLTSVLPRRVRGVAAPVSRGVFRRLARSSDLFHSTYYTTPPTPSVPSVVTVYDMIIERMPGCFPSAAVREETARKRTAIESATAIITISRATAHDLCAIYPSCAERITPIHLGHEHLVSSDTGARGVSPLPPGLDRPFALFVGDRAGYKNFRVVLEALAERGWPADLRLAVVGPAWSADEREALARFPVASRIVHLGRVPDATLAALYRGASCVLVPALMEGFGLPVIEAHAAGAPLVCSDTPIFREIAGEGARFFDPARPDSLAVAVAEVLAPSTATALVAHGTANLERFSWDRCAHETWDVYLRAARSR